MAPEIKRGPVAILAFALTGCRANEREMIGIGGILVIMFVLAWAVTIWSPKLQRSKYATAIARKIRKPVSYISAVCMLLAICGAIFFLISGEGLGILYSGIFTIGFLGFYYLGKWARKSETDGSDIELKMVVTSILFILALVWLITMGSDMLSF